MEEKKTFFIAKAEFRPAAGEVTLQKQTENKKQPPAKPKAAHSPDAAQKSGK